MQSDAVLFPLSASVFNSFELWSVINSNRCRPRSTTSKPRMQSESVLF
ncbi:hypothetical protein [Lapidilactobacillus wuchangensis]|nr:hypothetical protein [Lapidilactobacillus wuchangensis]